MPFGSRVALNADSVGKIHSIRGSTGAYRLSGYVVIAACGAYVNRRASCPGRCGLSGTRVACLAVARWPRKPRPARLHPAGAAVCSGGRTSGLSFLSEGRSAAPLVPRAVAVAGHRRMPASDRRVWRSGDYGGHGAGDNASAADPQREGRDCRNCPGYCLLASTASWSTG
jgi:hypothetical protein